MVTTEILRQTTLLSQLAKTNSSGCLEIDSESVSWKIYLHEGKIQYVGSSVQLLDQLKYHLHYFQYKQAIAALKKIPPSLLQVQSSIKDESHQLNIYSKTISWLLKEQYLDLSQTIKLIQNITKDEIRSCLWSESIKSSWRNGHSLPIWIPVQIRDSLSWNVAECLKENQAKLKQWQNCSPELLSIYQHPYFPPSWETKPMPASGSLNHESLVELTKVLTGRTSIRQLSILLRKEELQVAQILSPYIDEKIIYLRYPQSPLDKLPSIPKNTSSSLVDVNRDRKINQSNRPKTSVKTWKIVCIDDSPTILSEIKRFLDGEKFEITAIDDPIQAVPKIFTIKPDLILLDITMPRINGYKLCGLLRSSGKCDHTPIIMVTGNTGLIDKARAKISGATDYFTKPFSKESLNSIVAKHLK